jgi:hypothetical protein
VGKFVIDPVLISPETPSQNDPKMKISEKYILNFTNFGINYCCCPHVLLFEATALQLYTF